MSERYGDCALCAGMGQVARRIEELENEADFWARMRLQSKSGSELQDLKDAFMAGVAAEYAVECGRCDGTGIKGSLD